MEWMPTIGDKVRLKKRFDPEQSVGIIHSIDVDYYTGTSFNIEFIEGPHAGEICVYKDISVEYLHEENKKMWDHTDRWVGLEI